MRREPEPPAGSGPPAEPEPVRPRFEITDLSRNEYRYGMEAAQFPGRVKKRGGARGVGA